MHHWCTNTHDSFCIKDDFPNNIRDAQVWRVDVVKEALKHDFLLSSILAVTALHISVTETATHSAEEILRYSTMAFEFHDDALRKFRSSQATLTQDNNTATFAFSIINMGWTLALARRAGFSNTNRLAQSGENFVDHIKTFFRMMQGVRSIVEESLHWLEVGPFRVKVKPEIAPDVEMEHLESDTDAEFTALFEENNFFHWEARPDRHETNRIAIEILRHCFASQSNSNIATGLLWPAKIPRDFLQALDLADPVALLTVMHWGVLVHRIRDEKWWIGTAGRSLVSEISYLLSAQRQKYNDDENRRVRLLAWPRRQVGLEPTIQRR